MRDILRIWLILVIAILILNPAVLMAQMGYERPDADQPGVIPLQPVTPGQQLPPESTPVPAPQAAPAPFEPVRVFPDSPAPIIREQIPMNTGGAPSADQISRFLAGLDGFEATTIGNLALSQAWQDHSNELDASWANADRMRLNAMTQWAIAEIHPKIRRPRQIFYMFGGPDFLSVVTLFREVPTYILAGLEPVGQIPNLATMPQEILEGSLGNLRFSLRSVLEKSFFETREMREDLERGGVNGVLPILCVFAARTGHEILDYQYVVLSAEGVPQALNSGEAAKADGVLLGLRVSPGSPRQELYYFKTDLSDAGIAKNDRFMKFMQSRGTGSSYLKAASYLMHGSGFNGVRDFLLGNSAFILQDASGIPFKHLVSEQWKLELFGRYVGAVDIFQEHAQPDLQMAFADPMAVKPLPFGTGYRRDDSESHQIFALRTSEILAVPVLPPAQGIEVMPPGAYQGIPAQP